MPRKRPDMNDYVQQSTLLLFGLAACMAASGAHAAGPDAGDPLKIYVSDQYSYDDNLYRAPDSVLALDPTASGIRSFDDYINRLSGGIQARVDASRQVFGLNLRFDDVRYRYNDHLDYHGGSGDLKWTFDIGKRWSGLVDARYDRAQAGFSNYLLFVKDVVETQTYLGELRFKIGSRWALLGSGAYSESTHEAAERQTGNFEGTTARGGIEYLTPNQSLLALEYSQTDATFPVAEAQAGREIGFTQTLPAIRARYVYSDKTRVTGRAGYLKRDYTNPASVDFSGNIWNVNLYWEPRVQLYFELEGWRELKAYSDAEFKYFVGKGIGLTPTWSPTPLMKFSLGLSYEKQSYRGVATPVPLVEFEPGREDDVTAATLGWDYTPRDFLNLSLTYRWHDRDSNRDVRSNESKIAGVQVKVIF